MVVRMSFERELGQVVRLLVVAVGRDGIWLARPTAPQGDTIRLAVDDVRTSVVAGDTPEVFLGEDRTGRPIATRRRPRIALGEVSFLTVTASSALGAFVDWGLSEPLLVPREEQTWDMVRGDRYPVGLILAASGHLIGTMRVAEMLHGVGAFTEGEWVRGEAWRHDEQRGVFVILQRRYVGLLPSEEPHSLAEGEEADFRIAQCLSDGKVVLSLRRHAHEEISRDAQHVLTVLSEENAPAMGDDSSPEQIRLRFGLSKKAFKRAVGRLLRQGDVVLDRGRIAVRRKG